MATTQRYIPRERPARRSGFRTQIEGMQQRQHCWICVRCGLRYEHGKGKTIAGDDGKRRTQTPVCDATRYGCGGDAFLYFPSTGEANRYAHLRMQERHGLIEDLSAGVRFPLEVVALDGERVKVADYVADFVYTRDGAIVVEDYKGGTAEDGATRLFRHKARHFEIQYAMTVRVVSGQR